MSAADVVLLEFQLDWTRRETNKAARAIVVTNGGGYGMGLAYARDDSSGPSPQVMVSETEWSEMSGPARTETAGALSAPPEEKREQFRSAFFRVATSMFLGALDQTIIATALPAIAGSFGGLSYLPWVVTAYLLTARVAAPLYGRMGDAYGRKLMLLWALGLFVAGSVACAIAPTLAILICARALQGFGGGGLMTLAQALIGEVVSPKEKGRFQGWFGANFALASTLGLVVGGVLSQHLGWRSIFWINIPLGLLAAATALRVFIALLTFLIGAGLGSTMPAAQTMVQWAAGEARLGVGTALVSFSPSIGGVLGAALGSAVLLGALQTIDPSAQDILRCELASIGSSHVEASRIASPLIAAYRWVFFALGRLSASAAVVAWSIPNLDLAASPDGASATSSFGDHPRGSQSSRNGSSRRARQ